MFLCTKEIDKCWPYMHILQYQSIYSFVIVHHFGIQIKSANYLDVPCHVLLKAVVKFMTFAIRRMLKNLTISTIVINIMVIAILVRKYVNYCMTDLL